MNKFVFYLLAICPCSFAFASNPECDSQGMPTAHYCTDQDFEHGKVEVCHVPEGCTQNAHTVCVYVSAVDRNHNEVNHFPGAHGGDSLGKCPTEVVPTPTPTAVPTTTPDPGFTPTPTPTPNPKKVTICHLTSAEDHEQGYPLNITISVDESAVEAHLAHGDFVGACTQDCAGVSNGQAALDECNVCGGDGSSCKGCDGVTNSGAVMDLCGVCRAPGDPSVNSTCLDCFGVANGEARLDDCTVCRQPGDQRWNSTCRHLDCAGKANGNSVTDYCNVCNGTNACLDCQGTPNGGVSVDACGVCGGNSSCISRSCPLIAVDYHGLDLITKAKILTYNKTVAYYQKAASCRHSYADIAAKKIVLVKTLLNQYIQLVNSLSNIVEVCPGNCVDTPNKNILNAMAKVIVQIYRLTSDSQHTARNYCHTKSKGDNASLILTNGLIGDINKCHALNHVCR